MDFKDDANRNPLFIPGIHSPPREDPRQSTCPKCDGGNWGGRNVGGVVTFTCRDCGNKWYGGLPQQPMDPTVPAPPQDPRDVPTVRFERPGPNKDFVEIVRRPIHAQAFRLGAPIPQEGDE